MNANLSFEKAEVAAQDVFDREAETSFLGYCMDNPQALMGEWGSQVGSSAFHDLDTRSAFEAIKRLVADGYTPMPYKVAEEEEPIAEVQPPDGFELEAWRGRAVFLPEAEVYAERLVKFCEARRISWQMGAVARMITSPEALRQPVGHLTLAAQGMLAQLATKFRAASQDEFDADALDEVDDSGEVFLVNGVIQDGGLNLLMGPGGVGKSMLALDLAMRVINGGSALGGVVNRQGGVLYLGGDVDRRTMKRRVRRMREAAGVSGKGELPAFRYIRAPLSFRDPASFQIIQHKALEVAAQHESGKCALIVVDSLASYLSELDENAAGDMGLVINQCRLLSERTGACVLLVHHTNKSVMAEGSNKGRGSTVLPNGVDIVLHVERKGTSTILCQTKNRQAEFMTPLTYEILDVDGGLSLAYGVAKDADVGGIMAESATDAMMGILAGCPGEALTKKALYASLEGMGSYTFRTLERAWAMLRHERGVIVGKDGRVATVVYRPKADE